MKPWFRHYVGMTRDEKLMGVAAASKQPMDRVVYVWCWILESASDHEDAGAFSASAEVIAFNIRCQPAKVQAILTALEEAGRIRDGHVTQWVTRQYESDLSRDRTRRYRDRMKGHGDAKVTASDVTVTPPEAEPEAEPETEAKPGKAVDDPEPAGPGRADDLRSFEAQCRHALAGVEPPKGSFAPMALLFERGAKPDEVAALLRSEGAKPRKTPIASWPLWAKIVGERLSETPRTSGSMALATPAAAQVFVHEGDPEWEAWMAQRKAAGKPSCPTMPDPEGVGRRGWHFPARWPPEETADRALERVA